MDVANRLSTIQHKGQQILFTDYGGLSDPQDTIALIDLATSRVSDQPANSVRLLTNCEGTTFTKDTIAAMEKFTQAAQGIAVKTAVYGLDGMLEFIAKSAIRNAERNIEVFPSRTAALDWLADDQ